MMTDDDLCTVATYILMHLSYYLKYWLMSQRSAQYLTVKQPICLNNV